MSECTNFTATIRSDAIEPLSSYFMILRIPFFYLMQVGFTLMEAGAIRSKNVTNTIIKNIINLFVVAIAYWACGYAFAFGSSSNVFVGYRYWFSESMARTTQEQGHWASNYLLCAVVVAIATSSMAERAEFMAYPIFAFVIAAFIYPISSHWSRASTGWLANGAYGVFYHDTGGSGDLFVTAGAAALVAAVFVGTRHGRFDEESGQQIPIRGHSTPLIGLGAFMIMVGFLGMTSALMNILLGASASAIVSIVLRKFGICGQNGFCRGYESDNNSWSLMTMVNGALCGMVAVVGSGHLMLPWSAFATGAVAGVAYSTWSFAFLKAKIDDPLDAVAVYMGGGFWGLIAGPLFSRVCGVIWSNSNTFKNSARWLGWNILGGVAFLAWTSLLCVLLFAILKCLKLLRVPHEVQARGLDVTTHRERAYPPESYLDRDPGNYSTGSLSKSPKLAVGRDPSPKRRGYPYF